MHLNFGRYQIVWLGLDGFKDYCQTCSHEPPHYRWRFVTPKLIRPEPETGLRFIYDWLLFGVFFDLRRFAKLPSEPERVDL